MMPQTTSEQLSLEQHEMDVTIEEHNNSTSPSTAKGFEINSGRGVETNEENEPLWSIDDDTLFYPCGLINHSIGADKSVFVTWNENYLLNFRFKKSKKKKNIEMVKVRIPLPPGSAHLRSIHMLEYNTLLLMSDGNVYCFGSIKSLHIISWLSGVRCFARSAEGFSIIRHDSQAQRLLLEVYIDLPSLGKGESTLQHSYDITYDEQNIFHSNWQSDVYTLQTFTAESEHLDFMQKLFGATLPGQQVHVFSIGGHVFALLPLAADAEPSYNVELICVYATEVNFIRILPELNLCLIFLSCGTVDMWYVSKLLGLKQRQRHYTGAEWLDYDASSDNSDFYYTDGAQLVRLRFQYVEYMDDCQVQQSIKPIPNMLACTWVQHIEQLVCLSDNNIFYRIEFSLQETAEKVCILNDLTPAAIERLRMDARNLSEHEAQLEQLQTAIEEEHKKQQLIAVARNTTIHSSGLESTLTYRRQLTGFSEDTLLLLVNRQLELHSSSIYALLQLQINNSQKLLHSTHWQVLVYQDYKYAYAHHVPTDLLLSRKCLIVLPLQKRAKRLPEFSLQLVAFLKHHGQISAVMLPIQVKENSETYSTLFSRQLMAINLFNEPHITQIVPAQGNRTEAPVIQQRIKAPCGFELAQIASICNATQPDSVGNVLELYFVDSKLTITANSEDNSQVLTLESKDASAIYYFKQQLYLNISKLNDSQDVKQNEKSEVDPAATAALKEQIMKIQCEIQHLHGTQLRTEESEESDASIRMYLEALQANYARMRKLIA